MTRFFNTAGPCRPERHYLIPPERRLSEARTLIERGLYFVVHAPRQTGKTTLLNLMARALNAEGHYSVLVISLEMLQRVRDVDRGNMIFIDLLYRAGEALPPGQRPPNPAPFQEEPLTAVRFYLTSWSAANPLPIVLLIDEADCLEEDLLVSVLRQLRAGYNARPAPFPHSLALVGLRDIRDYKFKVRDDGESRGTASPFNIKSDSLTLSNFSRDEIDELYSQHTEETGQVFDPEAVTRAYYWTRGQPWLVNALARQIVEKDVPDRAQPITAAHVDRAKEVLIQRRDTHLDHLADKLREPRVHNVIAPLLAGTTMAMDSMNDDLMYVRDLGLVVDRPHIRIANPIYQEVIPRTLTYIPQANIVQEAAWYARPDGSLDMAALLRAFQRFFRQNADAWLGKFDYAEAGPQLILQAFLQRLINGGGEIQREFALGSGRVDLAVRWNDRWYPLELKVWDGPHVLEEGREQLSRYLDKLGAREGWLVLFDRRPGRPWDEKIYEQELEGLAGQQLHVFGA